MLIYTIVDLHHWWLKPPSFMMKPLDYLENSVLWDTGFSNSAAIAIAERWESRDLWSRSAIELSTAAVVLRVAHRVCFQILIKN